MSYKEVQSDCLPKDTLDLHGYTLSDGIRATTFFLDRVSRDWENNEEKLWVAIITGSGSHSSDGRKLQTFFCFKIHR